VGKLYHVDI